MDDSGPSGKGYYKRKQEEPVHRSLASASILGSSSNTQVDDDDDDDDADKDGGHRYGNFPNYYQFHPVDGRMQLLAKENGVLDCIARRWRAIIDEKEKSTSRPTAAVFRYTDVGCHEGFLTLAVANALGQRLWKQVGGSKVQVLGIDRDSRLISRAQSRWESTAPVDGPVVEASFQTADVLSRGVADGHETLGFETDLTSLFSITMWIHVHGGDEGLRRVLGQIAKGARQFILVEAQPSKCYRHAVLRVRKRGRPSLPDVSSERLELRANIEVEIQAILHTHGFGRVILSQHDGTDLQDVSNEDRTAWQRALQLYERIETKPPCNLKL